MRGCWRISAAISSPSSTAPARPKRGSRSMSATRPRGSRPRPPPASPSARRCALAGPDLPGLTVEIVDEKQMGELGMGALLAVGQGSVRPPRVVVMQYRGAANDSPPLAFIGKGVTFDTGGISIKPAAGMGEMKWDMAGAGVVI